MNSEMVFIKPLQRPIYFVQSSITLIIIYIKNRIVTSNLLNIIIIIAARILVIKYMLSDKWFKVKN
jgi:hypothetical protein